jgi:hypothetical protein
MDAGVVNTNFFLSRSAWRLHPANRGCQPDPVAVGQDRIETHDPAVDECDLDVFSGDAGLLEKIFHLLALSHVVCPAVAVIARIRIDKFGKTDKVNFHDKLLWVK